MLALYFDDSVDESSIIDQKTIYFPASVNTDNVTNFTGLFAGHKDTKQLVVKSEGGAFNTSAATNMSFMFANNEIMEGFNFDECWNFDTSGVSDMSYMFSNCSALTDTSDVAKYINTFRASRMSYMFSNCTNLESFNIARPTYS